LVVAAIKRLLPIGLNIFGGPEQELVQLAKEKMIQVGQDEQMCPCPSKFNHLSTVVY